VQPPRAPQEPVERTVHGDRTVDEFGWMADRDDPRLLAYLEAENAYAAHRTAPLEPLVETIVGEIRARTVETDLTVPVQHGGWWYYTRTVEGLEYAVHARVAVAAHPTRPQWQDGTVPAGEQVLLDENAEAGDDDYFAVGACETSPDGSRLAFSVDREGDERFDLVVRDLPTGATIDDGLRGIGEGLAWSLAGEHVYYTRLDDLFRAHEVWRHEIGTPMEEDVLLLAEPDERFYLSVASTRDDRTVVIVSGSKVTSEVRLLDAAQPTGEPIVVTPRQHQVLYDVEPCGVDGLVGWHNADRENFEICWVPGSSAPMEQWQPLGWTRPDELVVGVDVWDDFVVVSLRRDGLPALRVVPRRPGPGPAGFGEPRDLVVSGELTALSLGSTPDPGSSTVQVVHESLACPVAIEDYDVASDSWTLVRRREVPGYDLTRLRERRLWAQAPDGTRVPISLVHRDDVTPDGSAAGLLVGYGAYGIASDPYFSVARLSLLDRGVVYAIAHVRGGTELGWGWYEQGRLERKAATFTDFVACADTLVGEGWVAADRLAAEGGSAGGWLIGAVLDLPPQDRFAVVHAQVPFVDPLTTLLDPELPLTVTEWEEWGDPVGDAAAYRRIKELSPYEQVAARSYPAILVTASVHDTRVYVTEPAKWVARLRSRAVPDEARPVLLRTELDSGHAGVSGRYQQWQRVAWEWAVLLHHLRATAGR